MGKKRTDSWRPLLKSYPDSEKVNNLTIGAETLYTRLIAARDDAGCFYGNPQWVMAKLFTARMIKGEVNEQIIDDWIKEVVKVGLAKLYTVNSETYLHLIDVKTLKRSDTNPDLRFPTPEESQRTVNSDHTEHVTDTLRPCTEPVSLEENRREEIRGRAPATEPRFTRADVERILALYPRKEGFKAARHHVEAALVDLAKRGVADPVVWMVDRVKAYADSDAGKGLVRDHPKLARWWFGEDGGYDDDPVVWMSKKATSALTLPTDLEPAETYGAPESPAELAEIERLKKQREKIRQNLEKNEVNT